MTVVIEDRAMTVADLKARVDAINGILGNYGRVTVSAEAGGYSADPVVVSVYPQGLCSNVEGKFFFGTTFSQVLDAAEAYARSYAPVQLNATIRRMALAIIGITDEHGTCTEHLLSAQKFSAAEIRRHHEAACVRANEMAGGAPFAVVMSE